MTTEKRRHPDIATSLVFTLTILNVMGLMPCSAQEQNPVLHLESKLEASKDADQCLKDLLLLLAQAPNNAEARILAGQILRKKGFEELAQEQFFIADKLDPSIPESTIHQFQTLLNQSGIGTAQAYIQQQEKLYPQDPAVIVMKGILEQSQGQKQKAEFYFQQAFKNHPKLPGLASVLAFLCIKEKQYQEAIRLADRDLSLQKEHANANLAKGEALLLLGCPEQSLPYLQSAFHSDGVDRQITANNLSQAYLMLGKYGEALEPTLTCLAWTATSDRDDITKLKARLRFLLDRVKCIEMVNTLKVVVDRVGSPDSKANLYFHVGDLLDQKGYYPYAELLFEDCLELYPHNALLYLRIGMLKERQRDYRNAYGCYKGAHALRPYDPLIAAKLERLTKRIMIQDSDIAWQIKDYLRGGRQSTFAKK